jgi:ABC-type bacteriocin/lantibiotic exporter with double-glycine peptidase domain
MIIRILGAILGLTFIVTFIYMLCYQSSILQVLSSISGILMGIIFLIYGIGGKSALSRIAPHTANTEINLNK